MANILNNIKDRQIIKPSRELNDYMPMHVIELVLKGPKKAGKDMRNSKITVLGTAYKAEIGNTTNTPARIIVQELMNLGAEVVVYDPH